MKKLSVIIPAYNEEKNIKEVISRLEKLKIKGIKKEIIVIDDGSTDKTTDRVLGFKDVKLIRHEKNRGKGAAIRTGIKNSSGDFIIIQDADLEYSPKDIPRLLEKILEWDVVYGSRFKGKIENMSFSHFIGNKFLSFFLRVLYNTKISDMETCYKMFKREAVEDIKLESKGFEIEPEITVKLLKKGYKIKEVPITYKGRKREEKKISWKDGLVSFGTLLKLRFE